MTTKKAVGPASKTGQGRLLSYRIQALLHTMRSISKHEDQLCSLWHNIKDAETLTDDLAGDLGLLLEDLPGDTFAHDLQALHEVLPAPAVATKAKKKTVVAKRPAAKKARSR